MMETNLENYDIIGRLSKDSAYYKIKNKTTCEVCVWKAINCEDITKEQLQLVLQKINERKSFRHPNIVQFYNNIYCQNTKTLYIVTDYCKYGSLNDVIQKCLQDNEFLDENFIWHSLYHIACVLKLSQSMCNLNIENIFLDANFTIKLYFFSIDGITSNEYVNSDKEVITHLGMLLYQLCTLDSHSRTTLDLNFSNIHTIYSEELKNLIVKLCNNGVTLDSLLCHPTVLLKLANPRNKSVFVKLPMNTFTSEDIENYQVRLKNLKAREASVRLREEQLQQREHCLQKSEKKVALMERMAKEKISHAELYLKRARDTKTSSSSGKSSSASRNKKWQLDDSSLYSAANDTFIKPSTAKLDIKCIAKPANFSRTMSERKIRFKAHSPLKDLRNLNRLSMDHRASKLVPVDICEKTYNTGVENNADEAKNKRVSLGLFRKSKKLFGKDENLEKEYTAAEKGRNLKECRPLSWTKESKKNAFHLLRVMNSMECEKKISDVEIKHTYL